MTQSERTGSSTAGGFIDITRIADLKNLELRPFQFTDHKLLDLEHDIDPDNHFFPNIIDNCCYYTDEQYNQTIKTDSKLSIIHFNSRSLYANFNNIKEYLRQFIKPFKIIAISETWINADKGMDFELEGYEFHCVNRKNKSGGGVALYVDKHLTYKVVENMTTVIDNLLECLTIEIFVEKSKNVIVSCIYRSPGSSIETFKDCIGEMFSKTHQKVVFICGDFNIVLLNPNNHQKTDEFINTMYSLSLYPKITRPSRITSHSATLIDNIFTNEFENNTVSGLLINDISDHLPVFTVYNTKYLRSQQEEKLRYRRVRTEETINAFKSDLLAQNWENVYNESDIDGAYEGFLEIFISLYDKNCPVKQYHKKLKDKNQPWFTKGLQNACKKKNTLYRGFMKQRTKEAEDKYKKYKNKLTNIIRICRKECYSKILYNNKDSIKGLWDILNSIIKNNNNRALLNILLIITLERTT